MRAVQTPGEPTTIIAVIDGDTGTQVGANTTQTGYVLANMIQTSLTAAAVTRRFGRRCISYRSSTSGVQVSFIKTATGLRVGDTLTLDSGGPINPVNFDSDGTRATITTGSSNVRVTVVRLDGNNAPVITNVSVGAPDSASGVVGGAVAAGDPDGDPLTYGGSTTTPTAAFVVNADGTFTYMPTAAARHAAVLTSGMDTESFAVTVSDGQGGAVTQSLTVELSEHNSAPAVTPAIGAPADGVVVVNLNSADADGDTLTYRVVSNLSRAR